MGSTINTTHKKAHPCIEQCPDHPHRQIEIVWCDQWQLSFKFHKNLLSTKQLPRCKGSGLLHYFGWLIQHCVLPYRRDVPRQWQFDVGMSIVQPPSLW